MSEGPRRKDLAAAAICAIKRRVRQNSHNGNGCMVKPVNWNIKFKPRLGRFQEFLKTRKDQFSVLPCQDKLGFTVKDVTGNKTVAPTSRLIILMETPKRRSIRDGVAKKLLDIWKEAWRRGEGDAHKQQEVVVERKQQVVAQGRRRFRSRHPGVGTPQTRERPSPEDAGGSGGSGDIRLALGNWVDTFRSMYEVQLEEGGRSCSVKTTRPDGTVRRTRALIRCLPQGGGLMWAHSHVLDMGKQPEGQLRWLQRGTASREFVWKRP